MVMRLTTRVLLALCALLLVAATGCASTRGVSVGTDTSGTYAIDVTNSSGSSVDVYWTSGGDPKMLGTVAAGRKEHFIIAGATSNLINVTATSSGGRSLGPYPVVLEAGVTKPVTIR
jgi:hypothetical protein